MRLLLALLLVVCAACAAAPRPRATPSPQPTTPSITGEPGETAGHLFSRFVSGVCTGSQSEHVVEQVRAFLSACERDGNELEDCASVACDKLREAKDRAFRKNEACMPFVAEDD